MRKYNRSFQILESWVVDIEDPEKEFTNREQLIILLKLLQCQKEMNPDLIHSLDPKIKRGLSINTIREQLAFIIDKTRIMQERGRKGGIQTQLNRYNN